VVVYYGTALQGDRAVQAATSAASNGMYHYIIAAASAPPPYTHHTPAVTFQYVTCISACPLPSHPPLPQV
jgi:hypothetical protein